MESSALENNKRIHDAMFQEATGLSSSVVYDKGVDQVKMINQGLCNFTKNMKLIGTAYPVITNGDILPILQSLDDIEKNSILVVQDLVGEKALLGDIVMLALKKIGVRGIVCNGRVRDIEHAEKIGIAVWANGLTPEAAKIGSRQDRVDFVTVSNQLIERGDWLFGDQDGLVCVPKGISRKMIKSAAMKEKRERIYKERIESGEDLFEMMNVSRHLVYGENIKVEF
jgi:regulator of RNase E activity RraA